MRLPLDTENHSPQQQCEYDETIIIPQEPVHPGDPSLANISSLPNQNSTANSHTSDPTCLMPNTTSNTTLDLSFGIIGPIVESENGVLLMYTLEGVSSVTHFITAYEESQ